MENLQDNGTRTTPPTSKLLAPTPFDFALGLAKQGARLALRFWLGVALIAFQWAASLAERMVAPFEPVMKEVQKVPKKDLSCEGILYQVLRLQFLVMLYLSPFVGSALKYLGRPVIRARDWMVTYVKQEGLATASDAPFNCAKQD